MSPPSETTRLQNQEQANGNSNGYGAIKPAPSESGSATPTGGEAAEGDSTIAPTRKYVIIASLWTVLFMAALDGTIVVTLISSIASSFKASELSGWLGSSYLLSVCAFSSVYGRLSDIIGRKGALLVALFFFTLGTTLCATAMSMNQLLVARFVAGIGGGGLLTSASICMTDLIPLRQRGLWQGITNILFGTASALGGPLGGFINDYYGWRTAFGMQIPFLLAGGVCIAMFVNIPLPGSDQPLRKKLARIDYLGSLTLISSSSCLLLGMSFLSSENLPFTNPRVYGLLIASVVIAALFVYVEARVVKEPIMPPRLLCRRSPAAVGASYFIGSFSHFAVIFHFPLWFQTVRLQSASEAGLHLIPLSVAAALGSLIAGLYMRSTGRYWYANVASACITVVFAAYLATWNFNTSTIGEYLGLAPVAFGISAIFTFMLIALMSAVPKSDMAVATGTVYLFRSLGQVVGVSLSSALFQRLLTAELHTNITPALLPDPTEGVAGVVRLIAAIRHDASLVPSLEPVMLRQAAQTSYMHALKVVYSGVTVLNVIYLLICLVVEDNPLENAIPTPQGQEQRQQEEGESSP